MCQLRKWHKRLPVRQFYHYNKYIPKRFPMQVFDEIDLLVQVYENYVSEQGLPYVSADEQDFNEITEDQVIWIEAFQTLWDKAQ